MVTFTLQVSSRVMEDKIVPSVIEPSCGIGRVFTAVVEHCLNVLMKLGFHLALRLILDLL